MTEDFINVDTENFLIGVWGSLSSDKNLRTMFFEHKIYGIDLSGGAWIDKNGLLNIYGVRKVPDEVIEALVQNNFIL
jgi:hypothetical protein